MSRGVPVRLAVITHGRDGYRLEVRSVPEWVVLLDHISEATCALTRHRLCHPDEWMFKLGWGKDEENPELLRHSLGGFLFDVGQWSMNMGWRRTVREYQQPLSVSEVERYFPDARMPELESEGEDSVITINTTSTAGAVTLTYGSTTRKAG